MESLSDEMRAKEVGGHETVPWWVFHSLGCAHGLAGLETGSGTKAGVNSYLRGALTTHRAQTLQTDIKTQGHEFTTRTVSVRWTNAGLGQTSTFSFYGQVWRESQVIIRGGLAMKRWDKGNTLNKSNAKTEFRSQVTCPEVPHQREVAKQLRPHLSGVAGNYRSASVSTNPCDWYIFL